MNRLLVLLVWAGIATNCLAGNRTDAEMQTIAARQLGHSIAAKGINTKPAPMSLNCIMTRPAFNVYTPEGNAGFVIVSRDDRVTEILAYGESELDAENIPTDMKWWMDMVERNLNSSIPVTRRALAYASRPVANFVSTNWDQKAPYNQKTPSIKGTHAPVGCVATAMAQAMNVFKYPKSAQFEEEYYVSDPNATVHKAKVNSTYSWDYNDTYAPSAIIQGKKIAQLMVDCGYSVGMMYASNESGAFSFMAGRALVNYFQYPEQCVKYLDREYCKDDDWYEIIYSELQAKSPVIYGGNDEKFGGHAFVLSGIDENGLVYVNWGWSGSGNGFYAIDLMDVSGYSFKDSQSIVYGIRTVPLPTDHVKGFIIGYEGDPYTFRWGLEKGDDGEEHITLYADLPYGFINMNASDFKGVFGLFAQDLTDGSEWVIAPELQDRDTIPSGYGYAGTSEQYKEFYFYYTVDGEQGLKPGHTYRMSFGLKDDREGTWRSILCNGGEVAYDITYTGDVNTCTVDSVRKEPIHTGIARLAATAMSKEEITRVYDTQGRLIFTAPTQQFRWDDVKAKGIVIVRQGEKVWKVMR